MWPCSPTDWLVALDGLAHRVAADRDDARCSRRGSPASACRPSSGASSSPDAYGGQWMLRMDSRPSGTRSSIALICLPRSLLRASPARCSRAWWARRRGWPSRPAPGRTARASGHSTRGARQHRVGLHRVVVAGRDDAAHRGIEPLARARSHQRSAAERAISLRKSRSRASGSTGQRGELGGLHPHRVEPGLVDVGGQLVPLRRQARSRSGRRSARQRPVAGAARGSSAFQAKSPPRISVGLVDLGGGQELAEAHVRAVDRRWRSRRAGALLLPIAASSDLQHRLFRRQLVHGHAQVQRVALPPRRSGRSRRSPGQRPARSPA